VVTIDGLTSDPHQLVQVRSLLSAFKVVESGRIPDAAAVYHHHATRRDRVERALIRVEFAVKNCSAPRTGDAALTDLNIDPRPA
jgi:hypothetical protein